LNNDGFLRPPGTAAAGAAFPGTPSYPMMPAPQQQAVIDFDYQPPGKTLAAFRDSDAFARCLMGPMYGGRRTACIYDLVLRSVSHPHQHHWRWAVVRATLDELETHTLPAWLRRVPASCGSFEAKAPIARHVIPFGVGQREAGRLEVLFLAFDQAAHRRRVSTLELSGAWLDVARDLPQAVFDELVAAVGQYPSQLEGGCLWSGVMLSTRPPAEDHWIPAIFEREKRPGHVLFRQPSGRSAEAENLQHLPKGIYLRAAQGKPAEWLASNVDGQYLPGAKSKDDTGAFRSYAVDPAGFVTDPLGEFVWSKQREILESVRDHRRTAVKSCHDVGKSFIAARVVAWFLATQPVGDAFVVTSAPTFNQVRAILWREIARAHGRGRLPGYLNQTEWFMGGELVAFGRKPADEDMTSFQGIHAAAVLVVLDEACGIPKSLWDAAETLITNDASRLLAIGNPDDPASEFANICKPGSGCNVIRIDAYESPNFTDEPVPEALRPLLIGRTWVEERCKKWGEGSPLWIAKVRGEFPELAEDTLIPVSWIMAAKERELAEEGPPILGVDVARFGSDQSVKGARWTSGRFRVRKAVNSRDTMAVAGMVVVELNATGALLANVDDTGVGGGVTDRLNELRNERDEAGHPIVTAQVQGVVVGSAPQDKVQFLNLRAELYWALREAFRTGAADIDPADEELQAQLASIRYEITSKGQIKIESKDDMKARGLPSPDRADSYMLTFAPRVEPPRPAQFMRIPHMAR
jgi:hypothetical protein